MHSLQTSRDRADSSDSHPTDAVQRISSTERESSRNTERDAPEHFQLSCPAGALRQRRANKGSGHILRLPNLQSDDQPVRCKNEKPPSFEADSRQFSIFTALLNFPELALETAKHWDVDDLVSIYAISKDFHQLVNRRLTSVILSQSIGKAAESSRTFIFRCYPDLCYVDPAVRENDSRPGTIRFIPSLRWLRMVLFRETVVDEIISLLAAEGHRFPARTSLTLKKIWFTLDVGDNGRRVALIHNERFWTDKDLYYATMFSIKLDMRLTDPVAGNGEIGLRKMLLGQRSLSTLWRVLRGEEVTTQLDLLRMRVQWDYTPRWPRQMSVLGVLANEVGRMQKEGWGEGSSNNRLVQIDELVMREAVKRELDLPNYYLDMVLYGFVNKKTFEDIWTSTAIVEEQSPFLGTGREEDEGSSDSDTSDGDGITDGEFSD